MKSAEMEYTIKSSGPMSYHRVVTRGIGIRQKVLEVYLERQSVRSHSSTGGAAKAF